MTARSSRPDPPTPRPLSNWTIAAGALVVLAVAAVVWFVLLRRYGGQGAQVQLDAIRTAGTLVIGTGGAMALLLTARRQRSTELTLEHTTRDATERRITELYTKAADQLGSDQAPVRLAGLYALERLAHSTVEHRQTIVAVICAYLRMPYTPPQQPSYRSPGRPARRRRVRPLSDRPTYTTPTSRGSRQEQAQQERHVRHIAQDILFRNLRVTGQRHRRWWDRTPPPAPAWPGAQLNLSGAVLLNLGLVECDLDHPSFSRARFTNGTYFRGARFTSASFEGAQFAGEADFEGVQFTEAAFFRDAQFTGEAYFRGAQFTGAAFHAARFTVGAYFEGAQFTVGAFFSDAQFTGEAHFQGAQFTGKAHFQGAQFTSAADFGGARVASAAEPLSVWPPGWTTRPAKPDNGEDPAFRYLTKVEEGPPPDA